MSSASGGSFRLFGFLGTAVKVGAGAVRKNPLRSLLTAVGILVGIAAVTIVVALGEGATRAIGARIDALGANAVYVYPQETAKSGVKGDQPPMLTGRDAAAIGSEVNGVVASAPILKSLSQVAWRDANVSTTVIGSTLEYLVVVGWTVESGTAWLRRAETLGERVVLVGATVREEIFGLEDPVGRTIRIGRTPFRVVGLLEKRGQGPFGQDLDDVVVIPLTTHRAKLLPTRPDQIHQIMLSATSPHAIDAVKRDVGALLDQRHRIVEGAERDFRLRDQEQVREVQRAVMGVLQMLLLSIAAVSLVVGGIGVMNIMLVSVAERTREIGIRMAIGAREGDILVQFLVEAIVLALVGGVGGLVAAAAAVEGLEAALDWPMALSVRAAGAAFATSAAVGVVFGFLPARRAARLDPIAALGRE